MTNKVTSKNWTKHARKAIKSLAKIANEELEIANGESPNGNIPVEDVDPNAQPTNGEEGTAGPQEVVDAIEVIVSELEEVQEAIPAEPTQELDDEPVAEEPVAEPEVEAEAEVPEEEQIVAKLKTQVATLTTRLAQQDLESSAERYGALFNGTRVQEAKFNEVIKSGKDAKYWNAKIAAIEEYTSISGVDSSVRQAGNVTNWIKPRSRTAQISRGLTHL